MISETRIQPNKKKAFCPRCERPMISCSYKDYYKGNGQYRYFRIAYFCKDCEIVFPLKNIKISPLLAVVK